MGSMSRAHDHISLGWNTLSRLPAATGRPGYHHSDLTPGIVHIGIGNFHRAHQAWYLHRLMQDGLARDWGIIGAGVRPYDTDMRRKLLAQDCLTTLIELDPAGMSSEVVGSMTGYLPIETGNAALIAQMADPAIRIVSMTVTEGGYYLDATTGEFDADHADIQHDARNPDRPHTVFGAIVAALRLRRDRNLQPFTALSCDNLQGNGAILRQCVVQLAQLSDVGLADWIDQNGAFPNSMVDCIVPATTPAVVEQARQLGIHDPVAVTHENFRQWVIQDHFCAGRPPLERAGVTITNDVHRYEAMKLRILNGGHQLVANAGEILGLQTISDCMKDTEVVAFFRKVQIEEILPFVAPVPETGPQAYLDLVQRRFANSAIHDTTRRVAFDGSSRHPGFLLPTLREAIQAGAPITGLALAQALWARMCAGTREDGSEIEANDPIWQELKHAAIAARDRPRAWIEQAGIYGTLVENDQFAQSFGTWLDRIWQSGSRDAIRSYLNFNL